MGDKMTINHGKLLEELASNISGDNQNEQQPLSVILDNVDRKDLLKQTINYTELLYTEVETLSDQLRHRADMMRRRADEFDKMADSLIDAYEKHSGRSNEIVQTCENIKDTLKEHAHIEPTKV